MRCSHLLVPVCFALVNACAADVPVMGADAGPVEEPSEPGGEPEPDQPEQSASGILRVGMYDIEHGASASLEDLAHVVEFQGLDLLGITEADNGTARSGNVNQGYRLGQLLGMASTLRNAAAIDGGTLTNSLLFESPLVANERVDLPATDETRLLVICTIRLQTGHILTVGVTHLSNGADDRVAQAEVILEALRDRPNVILLGNLREAPDGDAVSLLRTELDDAWMLVGSGDGNTYPSVKPDQRIDYIMLGRDWPKPRSVMTIASDRSDHLPVIAELVLPDRP